MTKSRSSIRRFLAAASVLLCVVSSAKAQDKVLLRMHLHPGQTFDQGFVEEVETSLPALQSYGTTVTTSVQFGLHKEVLAVDEAGNTKLKITYQTITSKLQSNIGRNSISLQDYDSRSSSKGDSFGMGALPEALGQSVMETVTPEGKVIKVEGMDAIIHRMISNAKKPQERATIQITMKKTLESASILSTGGARYSPVAVAVGDSWTNIVSGVAPGPVLMKYTLMSSKNGVATLAENATYSTNLKGPFTVDTVKLKTKTINSGTVNGVIRVDEKTGLTISSELHMNMKNDVSSVASKNTSKSKPNRAAQFSFIVYMKNVTRSWTVKLPQ